MSESPFDAKPIRSAPRLDLAPAAGSGQAPLAPALRAVRTELPDAPGEAEHHLLDYVKVIYKRRWTAITAFLIIVTGVTVYTFTATPIYQATTRLLIEADNPNVVSFAEVINEEQAKADYYQTQYNILQSRALARRTMDELQLWERAPFGGPPVERFSIRKAVGGALGAAWTFLATGFGTSEPAAPPAPADETLVQSRAIDTFLAGLTVAPIRNSRLVDVRYRSADAALATTIVNVLARGYIQQNLEFKFMSSKEASDWLGGQLDEQRKHVEEAETKLQQYREQNDAISLEDRENIVVQKLTDLNAAVTQAKTERFQKEALYNQLQALRGNAAALDTFPAILSNAFLQQQKAELAKLQSQHAQLAEKLGDRHPEMLKVKSAIDLAQAKVDGEIAKIVQSVRNEYQAALAKENSLVAALNQQKSEALSMNRKAIEYSVLARDVESNKQLYESLMQRAKETGVSSELKTSNIRVVDRAERPGSPVSPRKQLNLLLALFGGGGVAFALAFFVEYADSRLKSPEEIKTHLRVPFLGLIPALNYKSADGVYPLVSNGVPQNFSEAFRAVRTNVLFSSAQEGSRSVGITSTGPGEGKSMIAGNLAIAIAQAGQRVLLMDADMRKPKVHEIFHQKQEPGLSNVLVGNAKASESVRQSPVPGLWLLTAGRIPPNPAELLGSQRFRDFLNSLKEHFDWVIIDSPPVMAVTDAALVANAASGVLFVVGSEMTSRQAATRALDQLEQVRAKFVGAVLNRVDLDKNAYYYSQYYRKEYSSYYTSPNAASN
jgi:capsular exopolysaccharide synthesis family protein